MKFSEQWLREWVNPEISTSELSHQLTMAGLEVDAVEPVAAHFSGVVVGQVQQVEPHPDADKLRVCQVDVGANEPLTIVCGAANVAVGMLVPTAMVGAVLPGDFRIKRSKLRGVPSHGMLCSASELGLAESSEGLMPLPSDAPIGMDVRELMGLDDVAIELGLTPNRGDCLSIAGIAREVGVITQQGVNPPALQQAMVTIKDHMEVVVEAGEDCPRYLGRVIRGVDRTRPTPLWMQERLRRSGIRSLGPLVDVTNYVLLELGQPMHAFALDKLQGPITVRRAHPNEPLTLLNDTEIRLSAEHLVITDHSGAIALAGIMGGRATAVTNDTQDIFLEAAHFTPAVSVGRARGLGLHTDSSHRFERGVDPDMPERAMERATDLLVMICGGEVGPITDVTYEACLPQPRTIRLRLARIESILGMTLKSDSVIDILQRLGFAVESAEELLLVTVPTFRFDLTLEVDLIEEVGRIVGYDNLPVRHLKVASEMLDIPEQQLSKGTLRQVLVDRGFYEAITYSFVDPKVLEILEPGATPYTLANPISADLAVMRTTLLAGLLPAVRYNLNRQQDRVRLFEIGLRFVPTTEGLVQEEVICGVICGAVATEQWAQSSSTPDFFDMKGDVEALLEVTGELARFEFSPSSKAYLHPGQAARLVSGDEEVGHVGMLHPNVAQALGLPAYTFVFECRLAPMLLARNVRFGPISKFPAIRRDIAVVVARSLPAAQLLKVARAAAPDYLTELKLFDVYQGEHIDSERKSLALGMTMQAESRTLTDEEVEQAVATVVEALRETLGATLRD